MTATQDILFANDQRSGHSLQRVVRRFPRRPGNGWKHLNGSVWEHATGIRIHTLGLARLPDGKSISWPWNDEYDAKRQQGYNTKRALMVWALTLIAPNAPAQQRAESPKV